MSKRQNSEETNVPRMEEESGACTVRAPKRLLDLGIEPEKLSKAWEMLRGGHDLESIASSLDLSDIQCLAIYKEYEEESMLKREEHKRLRRQAYEYMEKHKEWVNRYEKEKARMLHRQLKTKRAIERAKKLLEELKEKGE